MNQNSDTKWTQWIYSSFKYHDLNNKEVLIIYRHRYDKKYRKLIQAKIISGKGKGIKVKSSCHKNDVFNLDKGMEIIKKRMLMKILDVEYKEFISKMMNSLR